MPDEPDEIDRLRNGLADRLFVNRTGSPGPVEQAFRDVSRHQFLPGVGLVQAYEDEAIVTVREADGRPLSSSSQPMIMAIMLGQLGLDAGDRVLEIGAGTGYNAALLAHIVGETGRVTTVDIDEEIVDDARDHLGSAGFDRVSVVAADGADGYGPNSPYDRIILTVGAADIPNSWVEQLSEGGRLVLPLSLRGIQRSIAFELAGDHLESVSVVDCGFMPIRGALAGAAPPFRPVRGDPLMFLVLDDDRPVDTVSLAAAFEAANLTPVEPLDTGISVTLAEAAGGLSLWTVLHDPDAGQLNALGDLEEGAKGGDTFPWFVTYKSFGHTVILIDGTSAALFAKLAPGREEFGVGVLPIGPDGPRLAERLAGLVRDWDQAGRPGSKTLHISVIPSTPAGITSPPSQDDSARRSVIEKPRSRIVVDW